METGTNSCHRVEENFIVGGGVFAGWSQLPVAMAWNTFREANGATSLAEESRAFRLQIISKTTVDSRGLQGTPGESKPEQGNELSAASSESRAPSPTYR